jgi:hypothetical protein
MLRSTSCRVSSILSMDLANGREAGEHSDIESKLAARPSPVKAGNAENLANPED